MFEDIMMIVYEYEDNHIKAAVVLGVVLVSLPFWIIPYLIIKVIKLVKSMS